MNKKQRQNCRDYYKRPLNHRICKECLKQDPKDYNGCKKDLELINKKKKEQPNIYLTTVEQMIIFVALQRYQEIFTMELQHYIEKKKFRKGKERRAKELIKGVLTTQKIIDKLKKDVMKEIKKDKKGEGKNA